MTRSNPVPQRPSQAIEPASPRRSRRSKHPSPGNATIGRLYLAGFFLVLRGHDMWNYFTAPEYRKTIEVGIILPAAIVTTILLAAVWCRQNWARYLLILLMLARVVSSMIFLPDVIEPMLADHANLFRMTFGPVTDSLIAWVLICSPDIKRLTSRIYE